MKSLSLLAVAAASLMAMAAPASAYHSHHRPHYRSLRVSYRHGYKPEVLGTTPFGDTIVSGRMGFHRQFLGFAPDGGFQFDTMVRGSEESDPGFAFLGSRY